MNLFLDSANFTDGFTNTSSTFAPSLDESYYYDNNTWPPSSTLTPAPVAVAYSSGSGCLDSSCNENGLRYTRFIYGTLIVFFGIFLLLYCASQQSREQDSNDDLRTTTAAANPGQARPPEGAPPSTQRRQSTNRNRLAVGGMSLSQRNQFVTQFLPTKLFKASSSRDKSNTIDGEQQASIEMKPLPPPNSMDFDSAIPYGDDDDDQTDCEPEHHSQLESAATQELSIASLSVRECAVCLEAFCQNDEICTSNNPECSHVFHRDCMHSWLLRQEECPCCRRPYLKFDPTQEILL